MTADVLSPIPRGVATSMLAETARVAPSSPAVRDRDGAWTYGELDAAAAAVTRALTGSGVGHGDRVVLRSRNRREIAAVLFGTLRAGATLVPVSPQLTAAGMRDVLGDCDPAVLVTDDPDGVADGREALLPIADTVVADGVDDGTPPAAGPDDVALLMYTSGSTATPKGVVCPHRAVDFAARAIASRLGYRDDDVVLVGSPMSFDYGLYQILLSTLAGSELVFAEADDPVQMLRTLRATRATVVPVVPSSGRLLVRLARRGAPPEHVRMITSTGSALTTSDIADLRATFPSCEVVAMYGITECKRVTIAEPDADRVRPGSVGRALPGTSVQILDDHAHPLGPDEIGEIAAVGPHVMAGYRNAAGITAQRFDRDPATGAPRLRTGDYGFLDADGHLYFHGRRDDQFKRRGVRMSLIEIEAAASAVDGVRAAAALPPREDRDLELVTVGERAPGDVLAAMAELLEPVKVPVRCHVADALPLTSNGKVDRTALRAWVTQTGGGSA